MPERSCPDCRAGWHDDAARWCGHCGAALPTVTRNRPRRRRRRLLGAGVVGVVGVVVVGLAGIGANGCCSAGPFRTVEHGAAQGRVDVPSPAARRLAGPEAKELGGGLLVVAVDGRLVARDAAADRVVFARDLADLGLVGGDDGVSLRPFDGGIVVAGGGRVVMLTHHGSTRWQADTGAAVVRVVTADDQRIVLVAGRGRLVEELRVMDTTDGAVRFRRDIDGLVGVEAQTALVRDEGQRSGVTAVSLADGAVRWVSPVSSTPGTGR